MNLLTSSNGKSVADGKINKQKKMNNLRQGILFLKQTKNWKRKINKKLKKKFVEIRTAVSFIEDGWEAGLSI